MIKYRMDYMDKLRGLAILLVVMGHVAEKSYGINDVFFNRFYGSIHLPIFMFISGYFIVNGEIIYSIGAFLSSIVKKITRLMIPFGSFSLIYLSVSGFEISKIGIYWFLPALFYSSLITIILRFIFRKKILFIFSMLLTWSLCVFLYEKGLLFFLPFGLYFIKMFPFFTFGIIFYYYQDIIINKKIFTLSLLLYFGLWLLNSNFVFNFKIQGFFVCILLTNLFKYYDARLPSFLMIFGKNTLPIYMLHYFFLPNLLPIGAIISSFCANNQVLNSGNFLILALTTFAFSFVIIYFSLAVVYILRYSRFLSLICLGERTNL